MTESFTAFPKMTSCLPEIFALVCDEPHRLHDRLNLDQAQVALTHTYKFQEVRRAESGKLAEFAPGERPVTFTIIVIVLHEKVVVFVFEYRFHVYKIDFPNINSQYLDYTKIEFFIKN